MILVLGDKEKLKTGLFEVKRANELSVMDLANGGLGRATIYTENAVKELENKFNGSSGKQTKELENKFKENKKWI